MENDERRGGTRAERRHRRVWDLLPWYANGTLDPGERLAVEEHLAACARCREEAGRCREESAAVAASEEVAPSPHPVQLARLMARIDEAEALSPRRPGAPLSRLRDLLRGSPPAVRRLLAAQAAAVVLLAGALAWRQWAAPPPVLFDTLSDEQASAMAPAAGAHIRARIRMLFADGTSEREVRDLVAGVRGQIVGGPSPVGAWVVEVPAGAGADPLPLVLAHLRAQPRVTFAEPAAGDPPAGGGP